MNKTVGIIDYGAGNLHSVVNALGFLGQSYRIVAKAGDEIGCDKLILPGVGAFGPAMEAMNGSGLSGAVRTAVDAGVPLLGICLGMQLLFDESEEFGLHKGLGLLPGRVVPINAHGLAVPHMGWNSLRVVHPSVITASADEGKYVYFVHSFRAECEDGLVSAYTDYGEQIPASVARGCVLGAQFHPEKSGDDGIAMLRRFCDK